MNQIFKKQKSSHIHFIGSLIIFSLLLSSSIFASPAQLLNPLLAPSYTDIFTDPFTAPTEEASLIRASEKACAQLMNNLATSTDTGLMLECSHFYWHNQMLDSPPASYNNMIKIGYRYLELVPKDEEEYLNTTWLLWSRWVTFKQFKEKNPDANDEILKKNFPFGHNGLALALELLKSGQRITKTASFYYSSAEAMWPVARFHDPSLYSFVLEGFTISQFIAKDKNEKLYAQVALGLVHKQLKQYHPALYWLQEAKNLNLDYRYPGLLEQLIEQVLEAIRDESAITK